MTNLYFEQLAKRHLIPLHPPLYLLIGLTQISILTLNEKQGDPKPLPLPLTCHCFPDQNIRCFQFISTLKLGFMVMVSIFLINCSKTMFTHIDHNIDLPDWCLGLPGQCVGLLGRCHGQSSFESRIADAIYSPCRHL